MFYGFNLGKLNKQARPRKPFSQRTGLFGRELKDELKEQYHTNYKTKDNVTASGIVTKTNKKLEYKGLPDVIIERIIAILIVVLIASILSRMEFLAGFF